MTTPRRPYTVLAMQPELPDRLFDEATTTRLRTVADVSAAPVLTEFTSPASRAALANAEILLTGWDCPLIDADVLDGAPNLRAIVHAAGTVKDHVDPVCFERGLLVSTAAEANAIPVAEYTLAIILLAGKGFWRAQQLYTTRRTFIDLLSEFPEVGNFRRTVGLVGASRVGRHVLQLLRTFDFEVLVTDPYVDAAAIAALGAVHVELDTLLERSDIVSLHAPALPATEHLLDARRLALLRPGATLINTARGSLIDHDALLAELTTGRVNAVLDVTTPEPLAADSPLFTLPNVLLTPHLAGAAGVELRRLGAWAVDEIARYATGLPFAAPVTARDIGTIA